MNLADIPAYNARVKMVATHRRQATGPAVAPGIYVLVNGTRHSGPYTREELVEKWRTGKVNAATPFAKPGMLSWLPLAMLLTECDEQRIRQVHPVAIKRRSAAPKAVIRPRSRLAVWQWMLGKIWSQAS